MGGKVHEYKVKEELQKIKKIFLNIFMEKKNENKNKKRKKRNEKLVLKNGRRIFRRRNGEYQRFILTHLFIHIYNTYINNYLEICKRRE